MWSAACKWSAQQHSPSESLAQSIFAGCLQDHAFYLHLEALEVSESGTTGSRMRVDTAIELYRQAIAETEEAQRCAPGNDVLTDNLSAMRKNLSRLQSRKDTLDLFGDVGDYL